MVTESVAILSIDTFVAGGVLIFKVETMLDTGIVRNL
jgi:hypothetical protein